MPKGINLALKDFEVAITAVINNSGLPICVVRLVLEKLLNEVGRVEDEAISQETNAFTEEEKNDGNEDVS